MLWNVLLGASAVCSVFPAVLFCVNLRRYQSPAAASPGRVFPVSVLIPARNEEANIGEALACVLASRGVSLEVLVLDDDSGDRTAEMVQAIARKDARVRLVRGRGLPVGWNGKQHACWVLAQEASQPLLVFLDADVRVAPELFARMAAFREQTSTALVSGFPRLITVTWLETLLLPLIHFVLLAFLPMRMMRRRTSPAAAAGCGQFLLVEREAYMATGGHSQIRETMHDGLLLPRVLRRAGYRTDIADITDLANVRMYDSAAKVWSGLAKNATEGIATAGKILPLSLVLLLGQVVPVVLLLGWAAALAFAPAKTGSPLWSPRSLEVTALLLIVAIASLLPRLLAVRRFRQPLRSALLHPVGVVVLLAVQWYALARKLFGKPVGWRQRSYSSETGAEVGS
jgi:hypothetical protein